MTERCHPEFFEVLVSQIGQDGKGDVVLGKALSILPETELLKPIRNLLHRRPPADLTPSVLDRQDSLPYAHSIIQAIDTYSAGGVLRLGP
jgi:hypothetical protein